MSKNSEPETLDPVPGDDVLAEAPMETLDPVPDRVPDLKPKRKRTTKKYKRADEQQ